MKRKKPVCRKRYRKYFIKKKRVERNQDEKYIQWRNSVLGRDKHKCRWPKCKCRKRLEVHHIYKWSANYYLRYVVGNGITLCHKHHFAIRNKEEYYINLFRTILKE